MMEEREKGHWSDVLGSRHSEERSTLEGNTENSTMELMGSTYVGADLRLPLSPSRPFL